MHRGLYKKVTAGQRIQQWKLIRCSSSKTPLIQECLHQVWDQNKKQIHWHKENCNLGANIRTSLSGLHLFIGCDMVSAFGGSGKLSRLKLTYNVEPLQRAMIGLGQHWLLTCSFSFRSSLVSCIHLSYPTRKVSASLSFRIGNIRGRYFVYTSGYHHSSQCVISSLEGWHWNWIESGQLPPCEDTLYVHAQRANYQAVIWRQTIEQWC